MDKIDALKLLRNKHCRLCKLYSTCKTVCLMGNGSYDADVFLIGEAPGENEDYAGVPFIGEAGQILNNILREFGVSRDKVYVSNAVKCRPINNKTPGVKEIRACREYLIHEIRIVNPKIIIALGTVAMKSLLQQVKYTISHNRGAVFYLNERDLRHIPIISTYHPAAIKRDDTNLTPTLQDFEIAFRILKEGVKEPAPTKYYKGWAPVVDHCVIDLETTGLNPFVADSEILCVGTSVNSREGYSSWVNFEDNPRFREILADPKILKIGHNYKFDYKWLVTHGYIHKGPIFDTMVAGFLLDENRPSNGLKELLLMYSDMGRYSDKVERTIALVDNNMRKVPAKILCLYNAQDADGTYRLYEQFNKELEEQNLLPLFNLVMAGERVMADAEIAGVNIDRQCWSKLSKKFRIRIEELKEEMMEESGYEDFNPNSTKHLQQYLVEDLGLPVIKLTKKKQVSTDVDVLEKWAEIDTTGIVKKILRFRKLRGDYAKYLDLREPIFELDGKVHADFNIIGASTGRYSCRNPNLMAITKDSPIKRMFIPSHPKGFIMQVDYDQGELRVLAQQSKDKYLMEVFHKGIDVHKATAAKVFGVSIDSITDEQRFDGKTINFAIIYGIGSEHLGKKINKPEHVAAQLIREYKKQLPGVREYIHSMEADILTHGEVVSLFGRRRRIPIADEENKGQVASAKRRAVNAPIQGGLHELNTLSMVETYRRLRKKQMKSKIIMAIHDSVVFDGYPGEEHDLAKIIEDVFCNPDTDEFGFTFEVPLTVSISYGPNWKDLETYVPQYES